MNNYLQSTLFENIRCSSENFEKHYHDTYTIGLTYSGFLKSYNLHNSFDSYKNSCRINNPGEIHGGVSKGWTHLNFYPKVDLLSNIYEQMFLEKKIPFFENHIVYDELLFGKLNHFFHTILKNSDNLLVESSLIDALSYLVLNFTSYSKSPNHMFNNTKIIKESLEYINDSIYENITLDLLAKNSSLSKYHFLRVFKKEVGLTPHAFIVNERINRASVLMQNGKSISEASLHVGFNDQSHFTRTFKKYFGYSPKKSHFISY